MQPAASFQVTGLASEDIFLKRFFDKYGIKADFEQRSEFKNAVNGYLYDNYTPAHREAQLSWMVSMHASELDAPAAARHLPPAEVRRTIESGPYLAERAMQLRLIDRIGQVRDAELALLKKFD